MTLAKNWVTFGLLLVMILLVSLVAVASADDGYTPPHDKPGPAVDTLYFRAFDVDRAPLELQAGEMDLYFFSLKTAAARELR